MNDDRECILIVDDTPHNLRLLSSMLTNEGYKTLVAPNGERALASLGKVLPDLILLDIMMPGMDGYEVCERLKADKRTREIPVLFISALSEEFEKTRAFDVGGVDYITKPFQESEVFARTKTHLALKRSRDELIRSNDQLRALNEELIEAKRQLEITATIDMLTGLANRRKTLEFLEMEMKRSRRSRKPFSLAIGDIDHFKRINDTHGHNCGDFVLRETAQLLTSSLRGQDHVGRWGGEEFLILLPETYGTGAYNTIEKLREEIAARNYLYEGKHIVVTMTFGLADSSENMEPAGFIRLADEALYEGKNGGRNCVVQVAQGIIE